MTLCALPLLTIGLSANAGPAGRSVHRSRAVIWLRRPFRVAPPPLPYSGVPSIPRRTCRASEVRGVAGARHAADGVVVDLILTTKHQCDIQVGALRPRLYDVDGNRLHVPVVANADTINPAQNPKGGPFTTMGFAWDGSWCGAPVATVAVPLTKGRVYAKFVGLGPDCKGTTNSTIIPGVFGYPGGPVQAAPPEWRFLTASLHIPAVTRSPAFAHPYVTFSNPTDHLIVLNPVPMYEIGVHDKYGDGTAGEGERRLPVYGGSMTVPAHGSLLVHLPTQTIVEDYRNLRGPRATATFAIAGVPTAETTTRLDHASLASYEGHCRLNGATVPTFTVEGDKECVSLQWRYVVKPSATSRILRLRWHGACVASHAQVAKRQTRRSVVIAVTNIETLRSHCSQVHGRVVVRLASPLGQRPVHHAMTQP